MLMRSIIFIFISLTIMFLLSPRLTLITLSGIFPILLVGVLCGMKIKKLSKEVQDARAELGNIADENFSNIRTLKAFANERNECSKF